MIRRLAVFAATLLTAESTTSAATPPVQKTVISAVSHGVKLTLMVPRRVYPRNALVRVVVTMRNLSQQDVQISGQGMFCCGQYSLGAVVRDTSGQILYASDRRDAARPRVVPADRCAAPQHEPTGVLVLARGSRAGRGAGAERI